MSDTISEAAKRKACKLANAELVSLGCNRAFYGTHHIDSRADPPLTALARVLQEHSDVANGCQKMPWANVRETLKSLILPDDPVDPVEVVAGEMGNSALAMAWCRDNLRAALAKHGLTITAKE